MGDCVMAIAIRRITPVFGAEVSGIDVTQPLAREAVAAIEAGMDRHAVLVFHDQCLTDDSQRAFTRNFGPLEASPGGHIATMAERRLPLDMQDASNLGRDNKPLARNDRRRMFNLGNGCGIPTARTARCRPNTRCCRGASSWSAAGTPSSPICGRRTMRWTQRRRPRSRTWCVSIR
jgi:hypothetical protein